MRHALMLLGELEDADLDWLFEAGSEQRMAAGGAIVLEGQRPETLAIVLEGLFELRIDAFGDRPVARLGPGEIVGELSFLTGEAASASVIAAEDSLVLAIPSKELEARLHTDARFAGRFYRALAMLIAQRLRERMTKPDDFSALEGEPGSEARETWSELSTALSSFKQLLANADAEALRGNGEVPDGAATRVQTQFAELVVLANRLIGDGSPHPELVRKELGRRLHDELLPVVLLAENFERSYAKPRGYAGDFLTIHNFYEQRPAGVGRIGPLIDRCYLDFPPVVAVRNRRRLLAGEIRSEMTAHPDRPVEIASLACGPATELFDVFTELEDRTRLRATGIDIDFQALAFVADRRDQLGLRKQLRLEQSNLVYLALGRQKLELPPQDLVYSIGLIDYFEDKFVVLLMNYVHSLLTSGGRIILGNFHPRNVGRAFGESVLDWMLNHRTEDDMNRLFAASAFGRPCTRILYEEQRINLFAECVKQAN